MTRPAHRALTTVLAVVLATAVPAWGADLWLHVDVDEGDGEARVRVNVPLSLVETMMPMLADEAGLHHGGLHFDGHHDDFDVHDFREIWHEIRDSPDMPFVTVEERDETVRVAKEGGYVVVHVEERWDGGERVEARLPVAVVDALLAGPDDRLDVAAALRVLQEHGEGELVTVSGPRETVRVWIDAEAEAR